MVRWYNPVQLIRAGLDIFVNEKLRAHADDRLLEFQTGPKPDFTEGDEVGEDGFWFDYMADTGDGFAPTFAMASLLSRERLDIDGDSLPRGRFLILGGDNVYPVASRQSYETRLKAPFDEACAEVAVDAAPHVYAVAGNHDWYDSLISFTRLFTGGGDEGRRIGIWRTRQSRSYFSIRLPAGWWIWGIDIRLEGDVDEPQREFFEERTQALAPGDRVIACTPEPDWLYEDDSPNPDLPGRLELFDEGLAAKTASIPLQLSGDIHNYQRFDSETKPDHHKLVSGGGGAFLYPTHRYGARGSKGYRRTKVYPSAWTSFALSFRCFLLPFWNPTFALTTAAIYVVFAWPLFRVDDLAGFVRHGGSSLFLGVLLVLASGFYAHAEKGFRVWGGLPHGVLQVVTAYLFCRGIIDAYGQPSALSTESTLAVLTIALAGAVVMPTLLGVYLFLSLNVFGFHPNEAFAALRIKRYKNFLRCRIAKDGTLTVFAIGLDHPRGEPRIVDRVTIPRTT